MDRREKRIITLLRDKKTGAAETPVKFSTLTLDLQECVSQIDLNPTMVFEEGNGAKVVGCLMVLE